MGGMPQSGDIINEISSEKAQKISASDAKFPTATLILACQTLATV